MLKDTVVRRLKSTVTNADGTPRFRTRVTRELSVDYTRQERAIHELLGSFAELRRKKLTPKARGGRGAADLVTLLLKKRLFSSPAALLHTVQVYLSHLDDTGGPARTLGRRRSPRVAGGVRRPRRHGPGRRRGRRPDPLDLPHPGGGRPGTRPAPGDGALGGTTAVHNPVRPQTTTGEARASPVDTHVTSDTTTHVAGPRCGRLRQPGGDGLAPHSIPRRLVAHPLVATNSPSASKRRHWSQPPTNGHAQPLRQGP
ncbi:hypothetical protein [Streptomyces edwardsiae]|uniref:Transposase n=1 Tax=Streptomyces edwardsiae TaxID=3075527 RepID=A0ABU2PLU8_9ACTN|nr:hypothetical protein [Streptomyces sp. DSM 41636]MDT0393144.1 hypothetical protein [Streptomyces sp. DSM 41636]